MSEYNNGIVQTVMKEPKIVMNDHRRPLCENTKMADISSHKDSIFAIPLKDYYDINGLRVTVYVFDYLGAEFITIVYLSCFLSSFITHSFITVIVFACKDSRVAKVVGTCDS